MIKGCFDTVLIAGGEVDGDFALSFLSAMEPSLLVAADRGLVPCRALDRVPDLAVGDFDSCDEETLAWARGKNMPLLRLPREKDDSDTQAALREAKERGARRVAILGAFGGRIDHALANLGLLSWGRGEGLDLHLYDPRNHVYLGTSGMVIKSGEAHGPYLSFFAPFGEVKGLTLEGFAYPLKNHTLRFSDASLTISNEVRGEGIVTYDSGLLLVIESQDA